MSAKGSTTHEDRTSRNGPSPANAGRPSNRR